MLEPRHREIEATWYHSRTTAPYGVAWQLGKVEALDPEINLTRCFGRSKAISGGWAVTVRRITFHHAELRGEGSNPASPSAIDLGSLLSSSVDQPQNPQQTETF